MIKFKQKEYTIQEGHYTGPKDLEKVPGTLEVLGKATIGGTAAGGVIGGVLKTAGVEGSSITEGLVVGGKTGFLAGLVSKFLLNSLHKPMKTVKFQEVDKLLRAKFGIYRISGFTTGDSLEKRKTVDEKFGFNDRRVTDYKISFCIRDNQVTMYTLGISDEELDKLNVSLDYYCKKFSGMSYSSKPINTKTNSYSVSITFTNYKAISDFIFEVSEVLGCRINMINDDVLIEMEAEKQFSETLLDKYDMMRVLGKVAGSSINSLSLGGPKAAWSTFVSKIIKESFDRIKDQELAKYFPSKRKDLGTMWLEDRLKRLGFYEGVHYTKDLKNRECNIRLDRGLFMVTSLIGSKPDLLLNKIMPKDKKKEIQNKVNLWTMYVENRNEFDILLKKIITAGINPNIFIG